MAADAIAPDPDSLSVWNEGRLVGRLWRQRARLIGFRYDSQWVAGGGFEISHSLPLTVEPFSPEEGIAHNFFANLLPEGGVREQIVRDLKIANTDFELLRAVGGECAGALSLLPTGDVPSEDRAYGELSPALLADLVHKRGHILAAYPALARPRLSLAGSQDKLALLIRDGLFFLPHKEAPSSHILKFEIEGYRHVPAYETFTTMLAERIDLPVVDIELVELAGKSCSLTARYDRYSDDQGEIQRLHQEDFCQALGYAHDKKYQDAGDPTFAQCFAILRDVSSEPAIDSSNLLRWQVFNLLAGNSDGHAKNLSLLHPRSGVTRLARFYDLVCTRAIDRIDPLLAFDVGGERDPANIRLTHWDRLAAQCDIRKQFLRDLIEEITLSISDQLQSVRESFEERFGPYPALQRVRISYRSPWQNGTAALWIGNCRRELLEHVVVLGERHLVRLMRLYLSYYHEDRCHLGLEKDTPNERRITPRPSHSAKVVALPRVGGLHHRYEWSEAA